MEQLYSPREASKMLGICVKSAQDRDKAGEIHRVRTASRRRRVTESETNRVQGEHEMRHPAIYARVFSSELKRDLESQVNMLKQGYAAAEVYYGISSGLRFDRQGFLNLLRAVQEKGVSNVIVTHRDS